MRKPLVALSLAVSTGLGVMSVADVLAAPATSSPPVNTAPTTPNTTPRDTNAGSAPLAPVYGPHAYKSNAVSGAAIVQTAMRYLGYPYTATGNSPSTGFSCIGFVSYVYRSNGIPLPGDLQNAMAYAPQVPFADLQPGDILYFQNTYWNGLSHAAIYIGGGRFIHAENYSAGVTISSFSPSSREGSYWTAKYLGANRPWGGVAVAASFGGTSSAPPAPPTVNVSGTTGGASATVSTASLYVHVAPRLGSAHMTALPAGSTVTIVARRKGWYEVQLPDGSVGWVVKSGVTTSTPVPSTTTTANPNIGNPTGPTRVSAPPVQQARRRPTTSASVNGLRVHSAPATGASVITSVSRGERVTVLGRSNGWTKVRTASGAVGWIVSTYTTGVHRHASARTAPSYHAYTTHAPRHTYARTAPHSVLTAGVRVHAGAGVNSRVVGLAAAGTHVTVLGYRNGWALVRLPSGQTGYVSGAYVRR